MPQEQDVPLVGALVHLVDGGADAVRRHVADRVGEAGHLRVSHLSRARRDRRAPRIAPEVHVHVAASEIAVLEEAHEVAAVLADRVDVLVLPADVRVERVRHPRGAVDRGRDLVGECLPSLRPGAGARCLRSTHGALREHPERERDETRGRGNPHVEQGSALKTEAPTLDVGRASADERRDLGAVDDDRVAAGAFELLHLFAIRQLQIGDRELARGHGGEHLEHDLERRLVVFALDRGEQEDLRVDAFESLLELFLVADLHRAVEPELDGLRVQLLEPSVLFVECVEDEQVRVGGGGGSLERDVGTPQDRQRARASHDGRVAAHDERLGQLLLGGACSVRILDGGDDRDAVALGDGVTAAALRHSCVRSVSGRHCPIGCQTVLSSRKLAISQGLCTSTPPWTTRFTFSAASCSSSAAAPFAAPRSSAFTSMWAARTGATSERQPVSRLTTPPGRSLVATASASSIAASGRCSDATATTALPPTSGGSRRVTRPSSGGSSGASTATTPVGSGTVKLKYGPATGFAPPRTCGSLSAQPAYQTMRSIDRSTSSRPVHSSANSGTRASTISARRYRT